MTKQNPNRPAQTLIIAFGDFNKKEKEPPPSWEDLVAFANSIEHECPVTWPHRRVRKGRAYKKWQRYAATLHRFVVYLQAGLPIEPGLTKTFYETKVQEERARSAMLDKVPPRKRGC